MSSIKKNYIYQTIYQLLIIILPLITSPYISRVLGAAGVGEYSYSYSIVYYFSLFALLGINNYGTREIASVRNDRTKLSSMFESIYAVQLVMWILVFLVYLITQIFFQDENLLAKIQMLYLISSLFDINWFFFGIEKFKITVTRNVIIKIISVVLIFSFVKQASDLWIYTLIMAGSTLASQIILWPVLVKYIKVQRISFHLIMNNIKPLFILFIPVVAASIYKYMDKIMLGTMSNKEQLGFYENSEKIMQIPLGCVTALGTIMLPRISNLVSNHDDRKVKQYIELSMNFSMALSLPLAFGLAAISDSFAPWFWGNEFTECGRLIQSIAITGVFIAWANVIRTQYLIPMKLDNVFVKATIYGALINFIINFFLIPKIAAMGAVIGTVAAEFFVAFYQTVCCRKELPFKKYIKEVLPYFFVSIIMYIAVRAVRISGLSPFPLILLEIIIGIFVYVLLMGFYFSLFKHISIKNMIRKLK